jgi:hypothetical protein
MSTYRIYFTNVTSTSIEVEADDLDEAIDAAYEKLPGSICAQCSGWGNDWSRDEGDWNHDETTYAVDGQEVTV